MTKLQKETAREKFRSTCKVKDIGAIENLNQDFMYRWENIHLYSGFKAVDDALERGWEVIYSKEKPKDDRSTASQQDGTEEDLRESPVTRTTRSGKTEVLMRIPKVKYQENMQKDKEIRDTRFRQQQKIKKQGRHINITGDEITK